MTRSLQRRALLRHPSAFVARSLHDLTGDAAPWTFMLRPSVRLPSLGADIVLADQTIASLQRSVPPFDTSSLSVRWEPAGGTSFPTFEGRLWSDAETLCTTWLRLEGVYHTRDERLHLAERGESTIGHRIALATARDFLDELAASLERLRVA